MPILPENRKYYGWHWRMVVRPHIIQRSGGLCERCGRCPRRIEIAHLDQDPANGDLENLAALCYSCHRKHDFSDWARKCKLTRRTRKDRHRPLFNDL